MPAVVVSASRLEPPVAAPPAARAEAPPAGILRATHAAATVEDLIADTTYVGHLELWSGARIAVRALAALAVLVLFYAFSLLVAAGLVLSTWVQIQLIRNGGYFVLWLLILPPLVALGIVLAIWPRFHTWQDPGRGVIESRAPELYAMLRDVSRATGQPMPRRVYLIPEMNAFCANRGMFLGRAMGIGVPLFQVLTVDELRSIVAHEYGHYARIGGGLGTLVYRAVHKFASASAAAGGIPGLGIVFEIWLLAFLRVAMPIVQQQELRADQLAYRTTGAAASIAALAKTISGDEDVGDFDAESDIRLFGSHPPVRDRIALARRFTGEAKLPPDPRPALTLIGPLIVKREETEETASL